MSELIVETMHGFGDNLYAREVVRSLLAGRERVYVRTSWPQLYHDFGDRVLLLRPVTELRTQRRNIEAWDGVWAKNPTDYKRLHLHYDVRDWQQGRSLPEAMLHNAGVSRSGHFEFPCAEDWVADLTTDKPLAIVHPPTLRDEWHNVARCPNPRYMQQLVHQHREFDWVEVIDLARHQETRYGEPIRDARPLPSLTTEQLIGLTSLAAVVVTGPSFMLPLGIALRTPTVCLYGGDLPDRLLVERWMLGAPYRAVEPKPFCDCGARGDRHRQDSCNKVLNPSEVERAFTEVACRPLLRDIDDGRWEYPVNLDGQYDESYYDNYARLACTAMGEEITRQRVGWTSRFFAGRRWCDVGPGACQFVEATDACGFDVNPATNAHLQRIGRYVNPELTARYDVLTFWDSLEHIPAKELDDLLSRARACAVSMPVYDDREHVLLSRHFKPAEHFHYFTDEAFVRFMADRGFRLLGRSNFESVLGRDGILTYAFERNEP